MSDGNPLWEFSLEFYAQPGVASACLALQDRCGVDVNVLLLMCWCGLQGVCIDSASLARLLSDSGGNVTLAARRAGKERRSFGRLLKKYGIDREQF